MKNGGESEKRVSLASLYMISLCSILETSSPERAIMLVVVVVVVAAVVVVVVVVVVSS